MTDVMSDEEIRENLLKLGVNVGPVVDSTRSLYRKKLAILRGEIKDDRASQSSGNEGSESENEEKEKPEEERSFSESYTPPSQIRARRSIHSYAGSSPPKSYSSSPSINVPPQAGGKANIVLFVFLLLGIAVILYFTLIHGSSTKIAAGKK